MDRLRASWKILALIAVAILAAAGTYAVASIPDSNGVITGCWNHTVGAGTYGALRVIDPSLSGSGAPADQSSCGAGETQITWNQQGPTGPAGPAGPAGPQGAQGAQGPEAPSSFLSYSAGGKSVFLLSMPPLKGDSTVKNHKGDIDLKSVSFGGGIKPKTGEIIVVKHLDSSSTALAFADASGKSFDKATIVFLKTGSHPVEYLKFTIKTVYVTSLKTFTGGGDPTPREQVTLAFKNLTEEFLGNRHTTIHLTPSQISLP